MKVLSVVGARPQFVKLAPVADAFRAAGHEHVIVHTGQHYDTNMSDVFFEQLGIPKPDMHLGIGSGSHGAQTGAMLAKLDDAFSAVSPDWVLVYGDTNSTIAGALSAVKLHLPLAHLEAGLRSFNRRMPEEHNRVLTDHAADLCLAPTSVAVDHLAVEGLASRTVLVGDVMTDVCLKVAAGASASGPELPVPSPFILATVHRAENTDDSARLRSIIDGLAALPLPTVLTAHPRLISRARAHGIDLARGSIRVVDPLDYPSMINAIQQADAVVTDSGGLQKEAFLLRTPCTTIRSETEWIETLNLGWNVLADDLGNLASYVLRAKPTETSEAPYGLGDAAEAVSRALASALG